MAVSNPASAVSGSSDLPWGVSVQVNEQLPVRESVLQQVSGVHC